MATWMKLLLLRAHPASASLFGVVIKANPGGLRKTDEAKAFRRKLLRRPIALRGDTEYLQSNMLGKVVLRYLEEVDDPVVNAIRALLVECSVKLVSSSVASGSSCHSGSNLG